MCILLFGNSTNDHEDTLLHCTALNTIDFPLTAELIKLPPDIFVMRHFSVAETVADVGHQQQNTQRQD